MTRIESIFLFFILFNFIGNVSADEAAMTPDTNKREMTQGEIDASIGRYGQVETLPEGFKFSDAEVKLWHGNHLENVEQPVRLYYEFINSGNHYDADLLDKGKK